MAQLKLQSLAKPENIKRLLDKVRHLNIFITEIEDFESQTQQLLTDQELHKKPLVGHLVAVKDNFCTKGIRTTCASHMLHNFIPTYDATVCQRLREAGTLLIGKTNLDEFGMGSGTCDSIIGPTKNVWGLSEEDWHISGGSSGGSAVAVATGVASIGIGSDTGGSTRNPASYCGIVGFKPTYGSVSRYGLIPLVNSMDVPGILTRDVSLCGLVYNVIGGRDENDSTTTPTDKFNRVELDKDPDVKDITIGIPLEYYCEGVSSDVHAVWTKVADELEDSGAKVKTVSLPHTAASIFVYSILNQCEVASNMARYDGLRYGYRAEAGSNTEELFAATREKGFNSVVKGRILAGNYFLLRKNYSKYFEKALKVRTLIAQDFEKVFKDDGVDVLLTPTTLTTAPTYKDFVSKSNRDQCASQDYCTQPANMAGIPALSLPITLSKEGLPISLQLMSDMFCEPKLFNVARWIEDRVNFKEHQEQVLII